MIRSTLSYPCEMAGTIQEAQLRFRLTTPPKYLSCDDCMISEICGGHELPLMRPFGCIKRVDDNERIDPDDMNPNDEERFFELYDDVGGLHEFEFRPFKTPLPAVLPEYVTMMQHTGCRVRAAPLEIVALPLFEILRMRKDGTYGPRFRTSEELRRAYHLRAATKILLVGVDTDPPIERFWREHRRNKVADELASLEVVGITTPNFSFFTDSTGFQRVRNWKRILLSAENFSNAGIPAILHLNAIAETDWDRWLTFLKAHPEMTVVCKEFQTGLKAIEAGQKAYWSLVRLQERLGRKLHPILVAGGRYYREAQDDFDSFTIVDSRPFMEALHRNVLEMLESERWAWVHKPTSKRTPIDDYFERSVSVYPSKLASPEREVIQVFDDPRQLSMEFLNSKPYFTSQPAA